MRDLEPTIRGRELGEGLRRAMESAGFNASEMARQLEWSPSRVSRILSGKRGGSAPDVAAFLAICGVRGAERERLMAITAEQHRRSWFQQHGGSLSKQLHTLVNHEDKAVAINQFTCILVPGLLQTGEYTRALLTEAGRVPTEEIDDRIAARLGRQNLFGRRKSPACTFYIHEFALRLPVGGRPVMSAQLHQLLRISVRPRVSVRVVPAAIGAHAGTAGSFTLMEFDTIKPVVYVESETSALFLELPIEVEAYRSILTALDETALPQGQSRDFIAELAVGLYGDPDDELAEEQLQRWRQCMCGGGVAEEQLHHRRRLC
jgi:transcriptional regulator with XRE-family HTH domain